jgi:DEAD/DEAH box helicase domain-containing protein
VGRAGRATGTALIVAFVNQQPHDLFFFARPLEMLKGRVELPGCWLDASAVLVRQYLAYCFDSATHEGVLPDILRTAGQLVKDLQSPQGLIPGMMAWVTQHEAELGSRFLRRFDAEVVQADAGAVPGRDGERSSDAADIPGCQYVRPHGAGPGQCQGQTE